MTGASVRRALGHTPRAQRAWHTRISWRRGAGAILVSADSFPQLHEREAAARQLAHWAWGIPATAEPSQAATSPRAQREVLEQYRAAG